MEGAVTTRPGLREPEFHLLDTAVAHLGATPFSIYNTSSPEQIAYLLGDAANRVMIVETAFEARARTAIAEAGSVERLVVLDAERDDAISLADLEAADPGPKFDFEATWQAVRPDDVLTLIYTSGTTGPPKGVQLTHANELAECRALDAATEWRSDGGAIVSFLPNAHIADRGLNHYGQMVWGPTITTCPDPAQVFAHVADARPTRFGSVPRMWEKLKAALEAGIAAEPDEARRTATQEAIALAAIGIPICEVWGMSELSCVATLVPREKIRFGTVGAPLPGTEIALAHDGEVLVRGGIVMAGYRNQPDKTAETIDGDGWLHTGDIGAFDENGYLKMVDRKKELIINAAGKNMSPANIEQHLKSGSPLIGQAIAIGDSRPYNVALIVLDPDASAAFAQRHGLPDPSPQAMSAEPAVREEVERGVEQANSHLSRVEQIKRLTILPTDWAPAGDELTPTMKLKRRPTAEKYAAEIESLYANAP